MCHMIYGNRIESLKEIKLLDYSFPCLNSLSETNVKRLEAIQNSAVRSILKLRYDTPSNILHNKAYITQYRTVRPKRIAPTEPMMKQRKASVFLPTAEVCKICENSPKLHQIFYLCIESIV
ncbi:hypothetical protein BpHYR1_026825 [Brachionus plicatilis]|uniref:RNA-directed DNA polymerase from mobile element jockey-like n=1 Tax=Brachionus plicatilis TaxID=10195 RepID=A0A3M7QCH5_BRAPC|nr:hypothetical protein BpHYR1_026825 [Brachionus plicatilis]